MTKTPEEAIKKTYEGIYVKVDLKIWQKMFAYGRASKPNECIGYLIGTKEKDCIKITDVFLPNQEVSAGTCDAKVDKVLTDFMALNGEHMIGWWHSHNTMGCFHSGTDTHTLSGFGDNGVTFALSIVISLPSKAKCFLKVYEPFECDEFEVPLTVFWERPFNRC
jgi:proteasome lid subunit RPN8/RPN11